MEPRGVLPRFITARWGYLPAAPRAPQQLKPHAKKLSKPQPRLQFTARAQRGEEEGDHTLMKPSSSGGPSPSAPHRAAGSTTARSVSAHDHFRLTARDPEEGPPSLRQQNVQIFFFFNELYFSTTNGCCYAWALLQDKKKKEQKKKGQCKIWEYRHRP